MGVTPPPPLRVRTDGTWRRPTAPPADGRVVLAGSPLRLFRLSEGGAHVAALAESGEVPDTGAIRQFIARFVDAGALHPVPDAGPFTAADVTVVLPAHGRAPVCLGTAALAGLRVVVVDDASAEPVEVDTTQATTVVRREVNGGPAAARNTGLAEVATPIVAFVDADVSLPDAWLAPLLAHFADDRVALVAPRIGSCDAPGAVARHERDHSPLDLGPEPARIMPGTRVSYVPAAVLVARTAALREADGFDEELRVGEDVDLVWRLIDDGHRCRYEPAVVAEHEPRPDLRSMLRQRVAYGTSAAPLSRRHPGALAPVRANGWSAAVWVLVALRRPLLAAALAVGTAAALVRRLRDLPARDAARLALAGHLGAGRQFAVAMRRVWWPAALVAALVSRRARPIVAAALVAPAVEETIRSRSARPLRSLPLAVLDDAAYGAGVLAGAISERTLGPLVPDLRSWPQRTDG